LSISFTIFYKIQMFVWNWKMTCKAKAKFQTRMFVWNWKTTCKAKFQTRKPFLEQRPKYSNKMPEQSHVVQVKYSLKTFQSKNHYTFDKR
jgi:hypothetical protein